MAIVQTIRTATQFAHAFNEVSPNSFTIQALEALFDYLDELSEDMGEDIELDPIAIRCDWAEYADKELWEEYADQFEDQLEEDDGAVELAEYMEEETTILRVSSDFGDRWLVLAF